MYVMYRLHQAYNVYNAYITQCTYIVCNTKAVNKQSHRRITKALTIRMCVCKTNGILIPIVR